MILVPQGGGQSNHRDDVTSLLKEGGGGEQSNNRDDVTSLLKDIRNVFEDRQEKKQRELDIDIESILKNDRLLPDDKARAYAEVLQKQRFVTQKPTIRRAEASSDATKALQIHTIVENVPKTYRSKAEQLVHFLKDGGISWTERGEMIDSEGKKIDDSHITDLVNDLLRYRKSVRPIGRNILARELKRLNIPHELVGNAERWQSIHQRQPVPLDVLSTPKRGKKTQRRKRRGHQEEITPPPTPENSLHIDDD